ncbi:MAG: hypothetical protein EXR43_00330 [Dehalococcoidia bacterium]|nr:hypothetical protein [Dehalococcoidia bacterium]
MAHFSDRKDMLILLSPITGDGQARRILNRATRIAGVGAKRDLTEENVLRVCAALSVEGGAVQLIAENIVGADVVAGRRCAVAFFGDGTDPTNAVLFAVYV